ncbi:MAG: DUF4157 domain-containing protein [Bacteroidetes bacterium]|nr:DUF4157 domain-containing protein [Bacteroidota bacterium]
MQKTIYIKENSLVAKLAAKVLKVNSVAIVIGSTIYLYNVSKQNFINNKKWLAHELTHIKQYQQYGTVKFLFLYLIETIRKGYRNNKFEVEARENEDNVTMIDEYYFFYQRGTENKEKNNLS